MSSAVSVSINRKGLICGLTKRGGADLDPSVILNMISMAKHVSDQLIDWLDSEISASTVTCSISQCHMGLGDVSNLLSSLATRIERRLMI
ncbi:uncharacterized protein J3R85_001230 [Psidium guajava]|nr:uncharacterized protein J3R85_001230 [Psidium guajava]